MESAEGGASYEAFQAQLAEEHRRMHRRELFLRLSATALLMWIMLPTEDWTAKTGETLVFASGPMLAQFLLWLGWFQRAAERWAKNGALQLGIIAAHILAVMLICDTVGAWLLQLWR